MKRAALLLAVFTAVIFSEGCAFPQQYRIEEVQNILVLGLDAKDDLIEVTLLVDSIRDSSRTGEEKVVYKAYALTGKTIFEISRNFHALTNKRITYYHMKYIIIGEGAARNGIEKYLNFLLEDHEPVFTHRLLVSRGKAAKEFIEQTSQQSASLADYLDSRFTEKATGKTSEVRMSDYAIATKRHWTSLYIPVIQPDPASEVKTGGGDNASQSANVKLEGYAIFREDRLVDYMDGDAAMGLNFVVNEMHSGNITVQDFRGQNASIEIMQSKAKITPGFGDPLSAKITVTIDANLVEYYQYTDVTGEDFLSFLEQQGCAAIQARIAQAVVQAQRNKADVLGIGDAFYHKDPVKWQALRDAWPDIFADLEITIEVNLQLKSTYSLGAAEKGCRDGGCTGNPPAGLSL